MAFAGFSKNSGPSAPPTDPFPSPTPPSNFNPNPSSHSSALFPTPQPPLQLQTSVIGQERSATTPSQDNFAKQPAVLSNTMVRQRFSHVAAIATKHDDEANMPTQRTNLLSSAKRTRSPPLLSQEDDFLGLYNPPISAARRSATSPNWNNQPNQPVNLSYVTNSQRLSPVAGGTTQHSEANIPLKSNDFNVAKRTKSPPLPAREDGFLGLYNPPNANARRSATSPNWNNQPNQSVNFPYITNSDRLSPVVAGGTTQHSENNIPLKSMDFNVAKRTKSPPLPAHEDDFLGLYNPPNANARRREVSPTDVRSRMKFLDGTADPSPLQMSDVVNSSVRTSSLSRPVYLNPPKRARSPPLQSAEASSTSSSIQLDSESEIQAKAKRLARFGVELSQPLKTPQDSARHKFLANNKEQVSRKPADSPGEEAYGARGTLSDYEGIGSSTVVVGLCPDMCPEPEREERERKGDLDRFERLDGDRNQTSKFLAVKKYNRTAEREADLIRPLPILRMTADYLLSLLDQPYDENFLGTYNFLWDRMRAIRMDLRMQHIFNQEAIYMLEQMIRLHIVAMHELCEYQRGEGFVEGFDAHLNIEQMNKTSVELFQMYDDHRKRGKDISTEEEFRGYYALLKLDKHPGYKVEPAELSLDLAKMTPELRSQPDIIFARNVARACRLGNYITFFRLARKATYLQACLMHAHFAKLRTQALASLHSGLQNNQGIPVSLVVKWLGMEGEDIESLLEYHGFSLRKYEELYMVKEGSFLNIDSDYPTKCSLLVHLKRSRSIVDDVKSGPALSEITEEIQTKPDTPEIAHRETRLSKVEDPINMADGEMLDFNVDSVPSPNSQPLQLLEKPVPAVCNREDDRELSDVSLASWHAKKDHELSDVSLASWNAKKDHKIMEASLVVATSPFEVSVTNQEHFENRALGPSGIAGDTSLYGFALSNEIVSAIPARVPAISNVNYLSTDIVPQKDAERNVEHAASQLVSRQRDEAFREKLRLILRKWKEQSSRMREIRDQREFVANAALSSLSLGPPIRRQTVQSFTAEELNIDYIARERYGKLGKSWARLNVSELVAPVLSTRNPDAKCITWKLLFLVQANGTEGQTYNLASKWLLSKLMGSDSEIDINLSVSLPGLSIWKKWTDTQTCCLSIIREMKLHYNQQFFQNDHITGSSCLLFLASGTISWDIQRVQLQKVLMFVPSESRLPLLVLASDSYTDYGADPSATIVNRLGLHEIDKRKISSFSVIFLQANSFFNDDQLKQGLQWLAVHSPHQPTLHLLKTRELILSYLRISTSVLENLNFAELSPGNCISAFNEALDRSAEEIIDSASANPNNWPSPEIDLLEKFSEERFVAKMYLPSTGWSSAGKIEPVISAINSCRLPNFPNDLSWLNQGSPTVRELQSHKSALEECLVSYLIHSTKLMSFELAVREASVMVQKGAGLELRGSSHCIVPKWLVIFRRIYNWQLMRLNEKKLSEVYILANKDCSSLHSSSGAVTQSEVAHFVGKNLENDFNSEWDQTVHSVQNEVSLDELVEISCNIPFKEQPLSTSNLDHSSSQNEEANEKHRTNNFAQEVEAFHPVDRAEPMELPVSIKNDSRLSMLLEQCNRVQDMISEKLSIYF